MFLTDYEEIEKLRAKLQARDQRIADLENTLDGQLRANEAQATQIAELKSQRKRWAANILAGYRQDSDFGHEFCAFCPGDISADEEHHYPDCIVEEARAALEEAHGDD